MNGQVAAVALFAVAVAGLNSVATGLVTTLIAGPALKRKGGRHERA